MISFHPGLRSAGQVFARLAEVHRWVHAHRADVLRLEPVDKCTDWPSWCGVLGVPRCLSSIFPQSGRRRYRLFIEHGRRVANSIISTFQLYSGLLPVSFSIELLWFVRDLNEFEVQANSLERIQSYLEIEQEPKNTLNGVPPAYWPASGDLHVENLSAHYSQDGPYVLRDLSFHVKSGERIGVGM